MNAILMILALSLLPVFAAIAEPAHIQLTTKSESPIQECRELKEKLIAHKQKQDQLGDGFLLLYQSHLDSLTHWSALLERPQSLDEANRAAAYLSKMAESTRSAFQVTEQTIHQLKDENQNLLSLTLKCLSNK